MSPPPARPRLLILAPRLPYPVVGGDRLRIYHVAKTLSAQYDLTLLSLCESEAELEMELPQDGVFDRVERIMLHPWRSRWNCVKALPSSTPLQVAYYDSPSFRDRAGELAADHDGVVAHLIRTGHVAADLGVPKFLEMTDAISLNYERVRAASGARVRDPRTAVYSVEFGRLRRCERDMPRHFDAAFLVSPVDRDYLFADDPVAAAKVLVCPNGVDVERLPFQFDPAGADLVFIGNMCSLQNYDAAYWMATEILPLIRRRQGHIRLRLIGRITPEKAVALRSYPGVDVTGEVDDIAAAAAGAAAAVAPLRLGAGVQNKILEYLALGLPTVTTTVALEGFSTAHDKELLVADGADVFADQVLRVLRDPSLARRLAHAGRHFVTEHHQWDEVLAPMREAIATRLATR